MARAMASGVEMTECAQREGFNALSAYRRLPRARRSGKWSDSTASGRGRYAVATTAFAARVDTFVRWKGPYLKSLRVPVKG